MPNYDLIIKNAHLVRHDREQQALVDIGIVGGTIVAVERKLPASDSTHTIDADGLYAFPGAVDAHQHWGIYNPLDEDVSIESRAAAQGGVTTGLTYMRTGRYYLNRSAPYSEFFPEVLALSAGRAHIDYGFHLAPMTKEHISEIPFLIAEKGVSSFKIFMFYGSYGLHGRSDDQAAFLMTPTGERYDVAHFEFVMRGVQAAREARPDLAHGISLSLHCETPEIMDAYTQLVMANRTLTGLAAYSASRPPHSEGLAVTIASYLAYETNLPSINLLHLSSAKAMDAAMRMAAAFPEVDFRREVTIGHLLVDVETADGLGGKVNPPIRSREDVEALWEHLAAGNVSWVASDHACCREEAKFGKPREDVFLAKSGFGGAEYLLPGMVSEAIRRGLGLHTVAALTSWNPARRFGLGSKGMIAEGYDADVALVDIGTSWTVRAVDSLSSQEFTPFEGISLQAKVLHAFLRGVKILDHGKVVGEPTGQYVSRPSPAPSA